MSLVAHSSFRLSNSDEEVLLVSDNIDDLFAIPSESKSRRQQPALQRGASFRKRSTPPKIETRSSPVQPQQPTFLVVTEELLRLVIDPITLSIMMDPVVVSDHCTYDRESITKWLITKGSSPNPQGYIRLPKVPSPCTGNDLPNHTLTPNATVKTLVELVVSSMQKQDACQQPPLPEYHDDLLRDYMQRLHKLQREQRTAENMKKLYGAHRCPLQHPLSLIRCGSLPRDYQTLQRPLDSITCSHCSHANIASINWYFHCDTCTAQSQQQEREGGHVTQTGYDICANCIANHRSHPTSPNNNNNNHNSPFFGGRAASVTNLSSAATSANAAAESTMTEAERDALFYNYPVKPTTPMPHMSPLQQQQQFLRRCFSMRVPPTATTSANNTVPVTGTANVLDMNPAPAISINPNPTLTTDATTTVRAMDDSSSEADNEDEIVTAVTEDITLTTTTSSLPVHATHDSAAPVTSNDTVVTSTQEETRETAVNTAVPLATISVDLAAAIAAAVNTAMVSSDVQDEDDHVYPFLSSEDAQSSAFAQRHANSSKLRRAQTTMSGKMGRKTLSTNMQTIRPSKHSLDTSFFPIATLGDTAGKGSETSSKSSKSSSHKRSKEKKPTTIPIQNTYLDVVDAEDWETLQGQRQTCNNSINNNNNVLNNIDWPEETLALMERETRQRRVQQRHQGLLRPHFQRSYTANHILGEKEPAVAATSTSTAVVTSTSTTTPTVVTESIQTTAVLNEVEPAVVVHPDGGDTPVTHPRSLMRHVVSGLFASFSPKHSHQPQTPRKRIDQDNVLSSHDTVDDNDHRDTPVGNTTLSRHQSLRRTESHRHRHGVRRFFSMHYYHKHHHHPNHSVASDSD